MHLPTSPVDPALFFSRHDANDRRLGDLVLHHPGDYARADVVLLGCPEDGGVARNGGRTGAAQAPTEIRRFFYRLTPYGCEDVRLFDAGDLLPRATLEATHDALRAVVAQIIGDGKRLLVLGGGNDLSFPDCGGLADAVPQIAACNIDAHFDVRADTPRNSGTPYRQLLEDGIISGGQFWEIGGQPFANSPTYQRYLDERGATTVLLPHVREWGLHNVLAGFQRAAAPDAALFWGLDMDVVRAADAPGVSAPNPTGLDAADLCAIASAAGSDRRTRLIELTEVNPLYDIDGRTSRLAAAALWHALAAMNRSAQ